MFTRYNTHHTPDDAIHQIASDFNLSDDALNYLKQLVEKIDNTADDQEEFDKELRRLEGEVEDLENIIEEYDEFVTKYLEVYCDTN